MAGDTSEGVNLAFPYAGSEQEAIRRPRRSITIADWMPMGAPDGRSAAKTRRHGGGSLRKIPIASLILC